MRAIIREEARAHAVCQNNHMVTLHRNRNRFLDSRDPDRHMKFRMWETAFGSTIATFYRIVDSVWYHTGVTS